VDAKEDIAGVKDYSFEKMILLARSDIFKVQT
jgi:hypothetical protein